MPRKTRRRISGTRRIRRRGTRIRGGNRRYHNGGNNPFLTSIRAGFSEVTKQARQGFSTAIGKLSNNPSDTPTS